MSRVTRSRQVPASVNKKQITRKDTTESTTKRNTRATSNVRNISDENSAPPVKSGKALKNSQSKASVLGSKLHSAKKNDSLVRGNTLLAMKSPVLRDRTNTTSEPLKVDVPTNKENKVNENDKKTVKTKKLTKTAKNNFDKSSDMQMSMKKYIVKKQNPENKINNKQSSKERKQKPVNNKVTVDSNPTEIVSQKNVKGIESTIDQNNDINETPKSDEKVKYVENNLKNRTSRKKNISMEAVEKILNEDDEELQNESDKEDSKVEKIARNDVLGVDTEIEKENKKAGKKFFKNKVVGEEINCVPGKKIQHGKIKNRKKGVVKKGVVVDNTFSPLIEEKRQSIRVSQKNLRPKTTKNYCEISKLALDLNSNDDKPMGVSKDNININKNLKGVPIYKTIKLSQENQKDKEEIYEFPDDSQEKIHQKIKKKKKVVKRITVKPKKTGTMKPVKKVQKKTNQKIPKTVQFEEQNEVPINTDAIDTESIELNSVPKSTKPLIPEHLQNAGDSTIAEASTIKILSDEKLEESRRISLTSTPPVPKTIHSELKLFGPKNAITLKPTKKYSNMVNHSLIRKSMSPITKVNEIFDAGSPWRAVDAFSRVNQIVQSTPQVHRLPLMREKKLPTQINKKSENSEDTINMSSVISDKLPNEKQPTAINENEVSPRKFGTVISNLSPARGVSSTSPGQTCSQSAMETASFPIASPKISKDQGEITTVAVINNSDNTLLSPIKSPKKFSTPSPFRFEKKRSKRIASIESQSKTPNSTLKRFEGPEAEAGPSQINKPQPAALRQSNLNNFLNLDEMPQSTQISTVHGIFDDINLTPITGKKPKCLITESNVDNAFGFDDCDVSSTTENNRRSSGSIIATERDVRNSIKGKLFPKARVKSLMPSRISENTVKKTLLKNVLNKKPEKKEPEILKELNESDSDSENEKLINYAENNNEPKSAKKAVLDAVSFSDTFDVLSENGDNIQSKIPDEIPLFVDLEPTHFKEPSRRSYNKRKRVVNFNTSKEDSETDNEDDEKPKIKKKKMSKLNKEENKRMQEWLKNINKSFDEIEHYDLVVE